VKRIEFFIGDNKMSRIEQIDRIGIALIFAASATAQRDWV